MTILVRVKHHEGLLQLFLAQQLRFIISGRQEFSEVNLSVSIGVKGLDKLLDIGHVHAQVANNVSQVRLNLILTQMAIVVAVPLLKDLAQLLKILGLSHHIGNDGADSRLEARDFGELQQILTNVDLSGVVNFRMVLVRGDPFVLQKLIAVGTSRGSLLQGLFYEITCAFIESIQLGQIRLVIDNRLVDSFLHVLVA